MGGRIIRDLDDGEFEQLFLDVRSSWFRLETLQSYDAGYERPKLAAFLRGEPLDPLPESWEAMIREHVAAGRRLERVHVIEEPLSDYIRYELAAYRQNIEAGEDVRVIAVQRGAWPAGVPRHDYWLFDDAHLWLMDYDEAGALQAVRLVDDPAVLEEHRRWRDAALVQSIAVADYAARDQPA